MFSGEGALVGAAEEEQCFGEVDRSGVDGVQAFDELAVVAVRIIAGHVEECLRDRQRRAQFVGRIGCEPLLFGDVRFELREHGVEGPCFRQQDAHCRKSCAGSTATQA